MLFRWLASLFKTRQQLLPNNVLPVPSGPSRKRSNESEQRPTETNSCPEQPTFRLRFTQRANWSDTSVVKKHKSVTAVLRRFTIAFYAPASNSFLDQSRTLTGRTYGAILGRE